MTKTSISQEAIFSALISGQSASFRIPLPRKIFIPTGTTRLWSFGNEITLLAKSNTVTRHLAGNAIFKSISVIDWSVLFKNFILNQRSGDLRYLLCLYGILTDSSGSRKGALKSWSSRTRPLKGRWSSTKINLGEGKTDLLIFMTETLRLPKSLMNPSDLLTFRQVFWENPRPLPKNQMGVGYKDKGSMGAGLTEVACPEEIELIAFNFEDKMFRKYWSSLFL